MGLSQQANFPLGAIIGWNGSLVTIPSGWALCDGDNGTPDLRNEFIVGAGDSYAVNDSGGNLSHSHTITQDSHNHTIEGEATEEVLAGSDYEIETTSVQQIQDSGSSSNLQPYIAGYLIMRIS